MKKITPPEILETPDTKTWVTPISSAKYWVGMLGRIESSKPVSEEARTYRVRFEYNALGIKLKEPEYMIFPLRRLSIVKDFAAKVKRHVVVVKETVPKQQEEDYEILPTMGVLTESYGTGPNLATDRVFSHLLGGDRLLIVKDGETEECFVKCGSTCLPYLLHYNGIGYLYVGPWEFVKKTEKKKPGTFPDAAPYISAKKGKPAPAVAPTKVPPAPTELSRTIEQLGCKIEVEEQYSMILRTKSGGLEKWIVVSDAPGLVHLFHKGHWWLYYKDAKESDIKTKAKL